MAALVVLPFALVGVTVATYLGSPAATRRRTAIVLGLRLSAFLLAGLAIVRPALAFAQHNQLRSLLLIVCDHSGSMTIQDESNHQSRWDLLLQTLRESAPELDRLREEQQVDVRFYKFASDVVEFQPNDPGAADGKRTDTGAMLRALYDQRDGQQPLRYLLLLSDGADNGTGRPPALAEAGRWRSLPCPIHAFACGNPTTADRQNDVAIVSVATEPALVPSKGKLTVKLGIDAPGFENHTVRIRMFLDDQEVLARDEQLLLTNGNMVKLECTAPAKSGEVKLRVQVDDPHRKDEAPAGDLFPLNNKIETYITITKEGVSVLLVDKQRAWEPQSICDALSTDPRIRVTPVWLRGGQTLDANSGDLFRFDKQQYDVIILGDVTAAQMRAVSPQSLQAIEHLVEQGAGFLMLGGYSSFGNSDWQGTLIEKMLPIDMDTSQGTNRRGSQDAADARRAGQVRLYFATNRRQRPEESLGGSARTGRHLALAQVGEGLARSRTRRIGQGRADPARPGLRHRPRAGVRRRYHASLDRQSRQAADARAFLAAGGLVAGEAGERRRNRVD